MICYGVGSKLSINLLVSSIALWHTYADMNLGITAYPYFLRLYAASRICVSFINISIFKLEKIIIDQITPVFH